MVMKLGCPDIDKNKMLLLIMPSMYERYREGDGARWF